LIFLGYDTKGDRVGEEYGDGERGKRRQQREDGDRDIKESTEE
jgi:hypothetical protein